MTKLEPMRDHWWWRPGWTVGRSFYTWHITVAEHPGAHQLASEYAPLLATLLMFDPIPVRWLHLTLQGVGFTDEVDRGDLDRVVSAAQKRCAELEPFTVTLGPARIDPEAFFLPVRPAEPLIALRHAIRDAIDDTWGQDRVPEQADAFRPHVSLGYSNSAGPAEPLAAALAVHTEHTAEVVVSSVSLIDLNRDHKAYEWTEVATVPFMVK